ncbi:response regulator receiver domain protein [Chitinispirillum alkaliphilum]|nr:response regulator receiver domain protein [Chitinispirillum alkaliphilum]
MKVYIVEDHEDMRIILKRTLKKNFPSIEIVGESETAEQALEDIPHLNPHLILVDISLPGMDGLELIRKIRPANKSMYILVVTGHEVDLYRERAINAGADDIVSKENRKNFIQKVNSGFEQ